MIKYLELQKGILDLVPGADIQTDNHGQIIIYTGLRFASEDCDGGFLTFADSHADDCAKVQMPGCTDTDMCDCGLEG